MDLDYRALSNAGPWCVGRLQTDADRARVIDGPSASAGFDRAATQALTKTVSRLAPRWFVVHDAHSNGVGLVQPRWCMSLSRGPMTRTELKRARMDHARIIGAATTAMRPLELAAHTDGSRPCPNGSLYFACAIN